MDYGAARTGLALSDPLGLTCRPLIVFHERDPAVVAGRIVETAQREGASRIVVGLPRPLSGGTNAQLEAAQAFADGLRAATRLSVVTWDERFTTKLAERGRRGGEPADAVAACHLLQNYLDACYLREGRGDRLPDETDEVRG